MRRVSVRLWLHHSCEALMPRVAIVCGEIALAKVFPLSTKALISSFPNRTGTYALYPDVRPGWRFISATGVVVELMAVKEEQLSVKSGELLLTDSAGLLNSISGGRVRWEKGQQGRALSSTVPQENPARLQVRPEVPHTTQPRYLHHTWSGPCHPRAGCARILPEGGYMSLPKALGHNRQSVGSLGKLHFLAARRCRSVQQVSCPAKACGGRRFPILVCCRR